VPRTLSLAVFLVKPMARAGRRRTAAVGVAEHGNSTVEERIADHRAQTVADSVMYREALATAAEARGWSVYWYDRERVLGEASAALGEDVEARLQAMGRAIGPPWQAKHKLAAAAALAAHGRRGR
jgi:hypothetical protein